MLDVDCLSINPPGSVGALVQYTSYFREANEVFVDVTMFFDWESGIQVESILLPIGELYPKFFNSWEGLHSGWWRCRMGGGMGCVYALALLFAMFHTFEIPCS